MRRSMKVAIGVAVAAGLVSAGFVWWLGPQVRVYFYLWPSWVVVLGTLAVVVAIVLIEARHGAQRRQAELSADQRRQLEAEAEARERGVRDDIERTILAERSRLLSRLDHELKNPVMATNLALEQLRRSTQIGADARAPLEVIATQTGRLAGLLSSLRRVADLDHRSLELEQVAVGPLVEEVVATRSGRPDGAERTWSVVVSQAPWPLPSITGDVDLLYLALFNLVDNAVKYTRPGDRIEVRAAESDGGVAVDVADTGAGIPADEVEGVWGELQRASTSRGIAGQGLGLPMVRSVVVRHGGRITLRSRVGQGTAVHLWLPSQPPSDRTELPGAS